MAKAMTKARLITVLAEKLGLPKKTTLEFLDALAATAYKEAKHGFTLPGLGKLVLRESRSRTVRNPRSKQLMTIPKRKRLRFIVAKAAKVAVLGAGAK